jgi:hypothetical protein
MLCTACGTRLFVDKDTFERLNKAVTQDLDNSLVCGECEREYEDLTFE